MKRKQKGFTILEMVVVISMASVFIVLVVPMIVNTMIMVQRESTMLNMFKTGDQSISLIANTLRPAVLPIVTDADGTSGRDTKAFRNLINTTDQGFGTHGPDWRRRFRRGTDLLPFAVPVYMGDSQVVADIDDMPFLGMEVPTRNDGYQTIMGARYTEVEPGKFRRRTSLHPALQAMQLSDFGMTVDLPTSIDPSSPMFDENLTLPNNNNANFSGYGVMRFVPYRDPRTNAVTILNEAELGADLNDDGTMTDSYMLGSIELVYHHVPTGPTQPHPKKPMTPPMVLLHLNSDSPSYVPLFRLVSWGDPERSPGMVSWNPTAQESQRIRNGYTLMINLLLFDRFNQQNPLSFSRGKPFLVRRFETMVELRNLSRQ